MSIWRIIHLVGGIGYILSLIVMIVFNEEFWRYKEIPFIAVFILIAFAGFVIIIRSLRREGQQGKRYSKESIIIGSIIGILSFMWILFTAFATLVFSGDFLEQISEYKGIGIYLLSSLLVVIGGNHKVQDKLIN